MNLRQVQYICEVARQRLNISAAAVALHTSQPGVSKQIKLLEAELGAQIFVRTLRRLSAITPFGEKILLSAQRIVNEISHIKAVSRDVEKNNVGTLVIATTHTQARYVLPGVMRRFTQRHPRVRLMLRHGDPAQIAQLLLAGEADLGVTTDVPKKPADLVVLPCHKFERVVVVPSRHPLLRARRLTLKLLAQYPLVSYEPAFTGRHHVLEAFEHRGLEPKVVLSAIDADVIKACVEQGFGIAVLLGITFDARRDSGLKAIPASHLFRPGTISVALHRQHYLRQYEYDFIEMFAARWNRANVQRVAGL